VLDYDHTFAPYVIPKGLPLGAEMLPDARWAALMARSQAQSFLAQRAVRLRERLPLRLRSGALGRGLEALEERWAPPAAGRLPSLGDAEFAYQRFAGMNPLLITRVRDLCEIPEPMRIGEQLIERVARGDVFIARHDALRVQMKDMQPGKFLAPTISLYCHAPELDSPFPVVPLAIQCAVGRPDGETAVFTPLSEQRWRYAKRLVGVADINLSELSLHLARTHLMSAPFAIAMRRKLPRSHPLHDFLLPFLRFNLFLDRMAWSQGVRKNAGVLVRSLAGNARWSQDLARTLYYQASFREQHFERDLVARGMDTHVVDYPYRDDGRLLWAALENFVAGYLDSLYPSDDALVRDADLHAFIRDLIDPKGGNVRGLLEGQRLETRAELTEILTQVLFVASPLHALAHYGSAAQLQRVDENPSFLTNNPLSASSESEPGPLEAMHQYTRVISTNVIYDQLGDFSRYSFGTRPAAQSLIRAFQDELLEVEQIILHRNTQRFLPFIHFLPSRIPNGITI
jgi:arachidonate 15-lipoxygenase